MPFPFLLRKYDADKKGVFRFSEESLAVWALLGLNAIILSTTIRAEQKLTGDKK